MKETLSRILVAAVVIPILLLSLFYNTHIFSLIILTVSILLTLELISIAEVKGVKVHKAFTLSTGILIMLAQYLALEHPQLIQNYPITDQTLFAIIFISIFIVFLLETFRNDFSMTFEVVAFHSFIIIYSSLSMSYILRLQDINEFNFVYILAVTWMTDTGAYFSGKFLGKHKLNLKASPNKTLEGFIGGVVFSVLTGIGLKLIFPEFFKADVFINSFAGLILMTGFFAVSSIFGDLAGSIIKRSAGVKNSNNYIPGHGGILDIMDSLLYNAPLFYFIIMLSNF